MGSLIIIYILTIIVSFCFRISIAFDCIKYVADNGYKIDFYNLQKINLDNVLSIKVKFSIYLPFFLNILYHFKLLFTYTDNKYLILDELRILDALEEMTEEEFEEYKKNPGLLNAIMVGALNSEKDKFATIKYHGITNSVLYRVDDETSEIEIIKIAGNMKKLKEIEQIRILKDYINKEEEKNEELEELRKAKEEMIKYKNSLIVNMSKDASDEEVSNTKDKNKTLSKKKNK